MLVGRQEGLTHTHTHPFNGPLSETTKVGRYQKGKTNLDFTEARDSGSGISWAICKSAPHSRQITMPAPHDSGHLACKKQSFTFLVPAHLGSPGKRAVKQVCVLTAVLKKLLRYLL